MTIEQNVLDKIKKERGIAYEGATAARCNPSDQADGYGSIWVITHPAQKPLYAVVYGIKIFIMASINSARALLHNLSESECEKLQPNRSQSAVMMPLSKQIAGIMGRPNSQAGRP